MFVVPAKSGRIVQLSRKQGVRYRDAVFSADGDQIITLSDESGEFEFMQLEDGLFGIKRKHQKSEVIGLFNFSSETRGIPGYSGMVWHRYFIRI